MSPLKTITLVDGVKVCVPDSLNLISSYVLEEQLDWFEDEIKFIRKVISDGEQIIDIGANYGLYTLSIAKIVGRNGKIYSFEPAKDTAATLLKSIEINNFNNVVLEQAGLSNESGLATLSINEHSELNSIIRTPDFLGASESIPISTLDECMNRFDWKGIDFVKIDAEGEEENIIRGGLNFFTKNSPLVMFEIKEGNQLHLELINKFEALDYKTYKLIPGLNILVPWEKNEAPDEYLLNLFCCKPDKAKQLSNKNFLVENDQQYVKILKTDQSETDKYLSELSFEDIFLFSLPYAAALEKNWENNRNKLHPNVISALNLYHLSKISDSANKKYTCLKLAFHAIDDLCKTDCSFFRLSTLARIAQELGSRRVAVNALSLLINHIIKNKVLELGEPFLLPSASFEILNPGDQIPNFIWSSLLCSLEKFEYFSSFYSGRNTLDRLNAIMGTGFFDEEIKRRINLIKRRFS